MGSRQKRPYAESFQNHLKTLCRLRVTSMGSESPLEFFTLKVRYRKGFGMPSNALPKIFNEAQSLLDREIEHVFRQYTHESMMSFNGAERKDA